MILIAYPPTLNCACVLPSPEMNSLARILFGWGRSSFHPILILASYLPNSSYWRTRCFQFLSLLRILQCNWGWFSAVRIAFLWFGFLRFTRVNMYPFAFQLTKVCIFFFFGFSSSWCFSSFKKYHYYIFIGVLSESKIKYLCSFCHFNFKCWIYNSLAFSGLLGEVEPLKKTY